MKYYLKFGYTNKDLAKHLFAEEYWDMDNTDKNMIEALLLDGCSGDEFEDDVVLITYEDLFNTICYFFPKHMVTTEKVFHELEAYQVLTTVRMCDVQDDCKYRETCIRPARGVACFVDNRDGDIEFLKGWK